MNRTVIKSKIDGNGKLRVEIDLGIGDANREVQVTIEPLPAGPRSAMTQQEWGDFIRRTAGSIADPTFRRYEQGEYEKREQFT